MSQTSDLLNLFCRLSAIPRGSGHEAAIAAYLIESLSRQGLAPEADGAHNVRCLLPASPGRTAAAGVILQAHTDMVCVKAPGSDYRPGQDPIRPVRDGEFLRSDGRSSLGADNGIAVAAMLSLALSPDFPHGPVLLLFTVCEEKGLVGAKALDPNWLEGFDYYINLDAFRGDAAIFASAGGLRQSWSHPVRRAASEKQFSFTVAISGLTGGHSGFDIHRGRQNAISLLLDLLISHSGLDLCALSGGSDYNAIPTNAAATVAVADADGFCRYAADWEAQVRRQSPADPELKLTLEPCPPPERCWDSDTVQAVAGFFRALPKGPQAMRADCPGTVAVSANAAVLAGDGDTVVIRHFARCATRSAMEAMAESTAKSAMEFHFTPSETSSYAPWEGAADNDLTQTARRIYRQLTGQEMEAVALHVGLESSLILEKNPRLTGIALGCDILDAHSVSERVRLASITRMEQLILALLDELSKEETK